VKLTDAQKTVEVYTQLRALNDLCFTDIDNPPESEFLMRFEKDDVFALRFDTMKGFGFGPVVSYAIVNAYPCPYAHLWQIATHPSNRGHGYATDLLKEVSEFYKGKKFSITLQVKVDNVGAQVLYLQNGYKVEGVLYEYFGPEQNGLLMRKELNGKS
jgi:ribosomal protein S18 acetylase RimI-like enzyme